ncbi:MAG: M23 family metallopeptidase [Candidatus Caenarcaniphilales bacterium]|nr:M23 family metallopeptidase [Candidatus Caenarcaniphilales bacterium]
MNNFSSLLKYNKLVLFLFILCFFTLTTTSLIGKSQVTQIKFKDDKILELIDLRKKELNSKISNLNDLHKEGLVSINQADYLKSELKELQQFEFIIKNPFTVSYMGTLQDKLEKSVESMKEELKLKEDLWVEGLISTRDLRNLEEKASLYNYILSFLTDESRMPFFLLQKKGFSSKDILGKYYPISSPFGFRKDPISGNGKQFHSGVDFKANSGTPIRAPFIGKVVKVINGSNSGGGRQIKLKHAEGFETVYMHLSKLKVKYGQIVQVGEIIGYVGNSGYRVTGPHLHFEIRLNGISVNPAKYLK